MLKALIANRDRGKSGGKVKPPTVEAVRNTILKLTGMVERKAGDVAYLGELVRRLEARSNLAMGDGFETSPFQTRTTVIIGTPRGRKGKGVEGRDPEDGSDVTEQDVGGGGASRKFGFAHGAGGAIFGEFEMDEAREDLEAKRQMGKKLRKAMKLAGARVTMA